MTRAALHWFLIGYSVIASTAAVAFAAVAWTRDRPTGAAHGDHPTGAAHGHRPTGATHIDRLEVERIDVREPDGTLRMVLSSTAAAPGVYIKGVEHPHPDRKSAGILFYNDEGTENGGLIFGGEKKDGQVSSYGHLSFDQYEQDQVISIDGGQDGRQRIAGITFSDRPTTPIPWDLIEHAATDPAVQAKLDALDKAGGFGYPRLYIGKNSQRASTVVLNDAAGHPRLLLKVAPDGPASIDFLDQHGKTVRTLTAER